MKTIYNRLTNQFEELKDQTFYLIVSKDFERSDKAEVIHLVDLDFSTTLALNSDEDEDTFKAVELFKAKNREFATYLDFFVSDNPHKLQEILNK